MQALLMTGPERLELTDIEIPEVPPGWALLKVIASSAGLFHTQMFKGMLDTKGFPRILGHEIVGEVVEARSPASPDPGTLVVADAVVGCGVCEWCIRGEESICPWMRHLGIDLDGGFAEYVVIPEANIFPLPSDVKIEEAVMLSSALPAAVHAVRQAGVTSGSRVVVSGSGSIGLSLCQVAKAFGATTVVAADVNDAQLEAAAPIVDAALNVSGMQPAESVEELRKLAGAPLGVDFAFEAAGHPTSVRTAIDVVRPGGTALMMGIVHGAASVDFDDYLAGFVRREVRLVTTFGFTRRDFLVGNALYVDGRVDLGRFVGPTVRLDDVPGVIEDIIAHGTGGKRYVVDVAMSER
jgi:threonine dehydrogenase-like Zn-dependent dehydrogenase